VRFCVITLVISLLISTCFGCSLVPAHQKESANARNFIRFPSPWVKLTDGHQRIVNDNVQYVVRLQSGEMLFTVKQGFDGSLFGKDVSDFPVKHSDYDYFSDNHFAVSLDGKLRVREASDFEWARATKPIHSYRFVSAWQNPQFTDAGFTYKGHLYRKTGASWGNEGALLSPRGRWIVIFSFTSPDKPRPALIPGFGGNGPAHGELYLDVYDLSSGERVLAERAVFGDENPSGESPSSIFSHSFWIEDRYLIVPLVFYLDTCLLFTLHA